MTKAASRPAVAPATAVPAAIPISMPEITGRRFTKERRRAGAPAPCRRVAIPEGATARARTCFAPVEAIEL